MSNVYSFSVKKRRELDAEFDKPSKGTEPTKGLYLKKKLWEDEKDKIGNVVSSANTDKVQYFSCDTHFFLKLCMWYSLSGIGECSDFGQELVKCTHHCLVFSKC
jgi:hypothetical protein